MSPLHHFLLIYDLSKKRLVQELDLGEDADAAARRYSETEAEYSEREGFEIVLIGADSLDTIRQTHAHYFDGTEGAFADLIPDATR